MNELMWAAVFVVISYAGLWAVDRTLGNKLFRTDLSERERTLRVRVDTMATTVDVLSNQLNLKSESETMLRMEAAKCKSEILEVRGQVSKLTEQLGVAMKDLDTANRELTVLRHQLEENNVLGKTAEITVLGIWPDSPAGSPKLDLQAEADAIYNAGFTYVALNGSAATVDGIVWEMDRVKPDVLEIGAHDDEKGNIVLSNGTTDIGWWGELVEGRDLELVVLLYCRSNIQDRLNIGDIMLRAGVKAVISFDRAVLDAQAVHFARMLYAKLAEGLNIQQAVGRAKLVVDRSTREMVRLRIR